MGESAAGRRWFREGAELEQPAAKGNIAGGGDEDDVAVGIGNAKGEDFGLEASDAAGREVDDGEHEPANQLIGAVVDGDLRAGLLDAERGAEVYAERVGGLARAVERGGGED